MNSEQFGRICPKNDDKIGWSKRLSDAFTERNWSKQQQAMFLAQTAHESSGYTQFIENLNYSSDRLLAVFPKYFRSQDVSKFNRNPEAIANVVYANRMGNGSLQSGEGYKYRGRGLIQVTGKANYMKCSLALFGHDNILLDDPDMLVLPEYALDSALWYWESNNIQSMSDIALVTKTIQGGTLGLAERMTNYKLCLSVL